MPNGRLESLGRRIVGAKRYGSSAAESQAQHPDVARRRPNGREERRPPDNMRRTTERVRGAVVYASRRVRACKNFRVPRFTHDDPVNTICPRRDEARTLSGPDRGGEGLHRTVGRGRGPGFGADCSKWLRPHATARRHGRSRRKKNAPMGWVEAGGPTTGPPGGRRRGRRGGRPPLPGLGPATRTGLACTQLTLDLGPSRLYGKRRGDHATDAIVRSRGHTSSSTFPSWRHPHHPGVDPTILASGRLALAKIRFPPKVMGGRKRRPRCR